MKPCGFIILGSNKEVLIVLCAGLTRKTGNYNQAWSAGASSYALAVSLAFRRLCQQA